MTHLQVLQYQAVHDNDMEISWELLDNPATGKEIIDAMERVELAIPGLEHIHSVLIEGNSSLVGDELSDAVEQCEDELYYSYQLKDMLDQIRAVRGLTSVS